MAPNRRNARQQREPAQWSRVHHRHVPTDDAADVEEAAASLCDRMGRESRAAAHRVAAERHRAAAAAHHVPL
jgi:hypothetical protein